MMTADICRRRLVAAADAGGPSSSRERSEQLVHGELVAGHACVNLGGGPLQPIAALRHGETGAIRQADMAAVPRGPPGRGSIQNLRHAESGPAVSGAAPRRRPSRCRRFRARAGAPQAGEQLQHRRIDLLDPRAVNDHRAALGEARQQRAMQIGGLLRCLSWASSCHGTPRCRLRFRPARGGFFLLTPPPLPARLHRRCCCRSAGRCRAG